MRLVATSEITSEMTLAQDILAAGGTPLLRQGVRLNGAYLRVLEDRGIQQLYVWLPGEAPVVISDTVSERTRTLATATLIEEAERLTRVEQLDLDRLRACVDQLIEDALGNPEALSKLLDIRTDDRELFAHSVNVAIMAVKTGITLNWGRDVLRRLGLGALLHDFGKLKVPKEILNKPGKLTDEERAIIRTHTRLGWETLRKLPEMSILAAHIAYQHHERWDGGGYPRGLRGEDILPIARVSAVADTYDAILHNRVYQSSLGLSVALQTLRDGAGTAFDPHVVNAFLRHVAHYLVGSHVKLNTGRSAIVVDYTPGAPPDRPIVEPADASGRSTTHERIDLSTNLELEISALAPELDGAFSRLSNVVPHWS